MFTQDYPDQVQAALKDLRKWGRKERVAGTTVAVDGVFYDVRIVGGVPHVEEASFVHGTPAGRRGE